MVRRSTYQSDRLEGSEVQKVKIPEYSNLEVRQFIDLDLASKHRVGAQVCMTPSAMLSLRSDEELRATVMDQFESALTRGAVKRMMETSLDVVTEADQSVYRVHGYFFTGRDLYHALCHVYRLGMKARPSDLTP